MANPSAPPEPARGWASTTQKLIEEANAYKGKGPEDMTGKGKGAEPQMEAPPKTPEKVNSPWDQYHPSSPSEGKGHAKGPHLSHPEWGPLEARPISSLGPTGMHWAQASEKEKEDEFGRAMRIGATSIDGRDAVQESWRLRTIFYECRSFHRWDRIEMGH